MHSVNPLADPGARNPTGGLPDYAKPRTLDIAVLDASSSAVQLQPSGSGVTLANNHAQFTLLTGTRATSNMQWIQDSVLFQASSTTMTVQFTAAKFSDPALSLHRSGPALDLVTLTAVPEPSALLMLAPCGLALLHRRKSPRVSR